MKPLAVLRINNPPGTSRHVQRVRGCGWLFCGCGRAGDFFEGAGDFLAGAGLWMTF